MCFGFVYQGNGNSETEVPNLSELDSFSIVHYITITQWARENGNFSLIVAIIQVDKARLWLGM